MKIYQQSIISALLLIFSNTSSYAAPIINNSSEIPPVVINQAPLQSTTPTNSQLTVITDQQIQASGATNVSEILQGIAGVQLQDLTGDGSQVAISMRGFGSNAAQNSLILINGVPLVNPDIGVFDLNSIPINTIEKIEIIQGSEGVLYGDQAVGGVINIITKTPKKQYANIQVQYGSYNYQGFSALAMDQLSNGLSYSINANKIDTDNYRDHNNDDENNVVGQVNYSYSLGSVSLNYVFTQQQLLYAGALTLQQVLENRRQAQNDTNFSNQDENLIHFDNQQTLSSSWELQTDIAIRSDQGSGFMFAPFQQNRVITTIDPKFTGSLDNLLITSGIDGLFENYRYISDLFGTYDNTEQQSAYLQTLFPINSKLTAIIGARAAEEENNLTTTTLNQNTTNQAFVTTISFSYQINPFAIFYLRRDGNYRFPKADENAFTPIGINGLKTQTGASYEAGLKFQHIKNQIDINVYQLDLMNEIAFNPLQTPTQPFGANTNLPPTRRRGLIISDNYHLTKQWIFGSQYSYVDPRFVGGIFSGNVIPFVAKNVVKLSADYFMTERYDLYAETIYTSSEFAVDDDANTASKVPPFSIYNLALRYHYKKLLAAIRINNLTNKLYNSITTFDPSTNSEFFYPAPGRNFIITISYQLW